MRESFTYLFKDNKWLIKFFTVFIFVGIGTYGSHFCLVQNRNSEFVLPFALWLPMAIGCLVSYIILCGYKIINVKAFHVTKTNKIIPFLRLITDLKTGLKYISALAIFHLCWYFVIAIEGLMVGFSFATYNKIFINTCCIFFLITFITYIIYWVLTEFGYIYMYAETPCVLNFFKVKELFSKIWCHKKQYFAAWGFSILLWIMITGFYVLMNYLLICKLNEISALWINTIIMSLLVTYKFFVSNMLIVKAFDESRSVEE